MLGVNRSRVWMAQGVVSVDERYDNQRSDGELLAESVFSWSRQALTNQTVMLLVG
jgi:hypothetical protein